MKAILVVTLATLLVASTSAYGWIKCPSVNGINVDLIPDPHDCTSFYVCNNGVPHWFRCYGGLVFNRKEKVCDWPERAGCYRESRPWWQAEPIRPWKPQPTTEQWIPDETGTTQPWNPSEANIWDPWNLTGTTPSEAPIAAETSSWEQWDSTQTDLTFDPWYEWYLAQRNANPELFGRNVPWRSAESSSSRSAKQADSSTTTAMPRSGSIRHPSRLLPLRPTKIRWPLRAMRTTRLPLRALPGVKNP